MPADTSTAGESSSSGGGMVSQECVDFCALYFMNCGDNPANDYGDEASCGDACSGFDMKTYDCKNYHAGVAGDDPDTHCPHANLDGGGVCPMS